MKIESVTLKPGVLFARTPGGATLLDISADRYIALTPVSAAIWAGLAATQSVEELVRHIMEARSVGPAKAEALLRHQLNRWESADLLSQNVPCAVNLPKPKTGLQAPPLELCADRVAQEPLMPLLMADLLTTELKYRRALRKFGLAETLVRLQHESGTRPEEAEAIIHRVLRSYHALRRAFRQGRTAHDCLLRSLTLVAVLRRRGVQADLCIGIIDLPFSAHAWVVGHGFLLNETLEKHNEYVVIGRF